MTFDEDEYFAHYGTPRHSGRYPWGSGGHGKQDNETFLDHVQELKDKGFKDGEIVKALGLESTTQLRALKSIAKNERKQQRISMAQRLRDKGWSHAAIADRMGLAGESSVRALLAPGVKEKADVLTSVSDMLKEEVAAKTYVDIGLGAEHWIHTGITKNRLATAVAILKEQGYKVHSVPHPQLGTGHDTEMKVLAPPGSTQKEVFQNRDKIRLVGHFSDDGGRTFANREDYKPIPLDPDRVTIRYDGEGGEEADGMIYVRPGVEDLSLGKNRYAQVRIQVGDKHYLKGMALYRDDLPPGVDLLFNTKKENTGNKFDAMKPLTSDPDFPFGSVVNPVIENPGTPKERVVSVMNSVYEEGDWELWKKSLSTQFLSKQSPSLARTQLNMTYERRKKELDDIMELTNPTIKKKLLERFADDTDSAAVHMAAAALPRQNWHVILPIESLPPSNIYAQKYRDGERVVLIRYPHGGTFEIPELVVNNKHPESRRLLGDGVDVVGIHHSVAKRLSGADFDGDTVLVIPNNEGKVKITAALEGLKDFDPIKEYPAYEGMPRMTKERKQNEMGIISNLITDMTIRHASHSEIARAIRHSMVVIDAERHNLDFKESARHNNIKQLKEKYQESARGGASTLISRATSPLYIPDRRLRRASEGGPIDEMGRKVWVETGKLTRNKSGKMIPKMTRSTKLAETDDAHTLISTPPGTPIERLYGDHSNRLKRMANEARLAASKTPTLKRVPSSARAYAKEVASLKSKVALAERRKPLERQAQVVAQTVKRARVTANPNLDKETIKKIGYEELNKARARLGLKKERIEITPKEWDAIQAGAISNSMLVKIIDSTDVDVVRDLATPRQRLVMTPAKTRRAQAMLSSGYTRAQVADQLGVSLSTLDLSIKGEGAYE